MDPHNARNLVLQLSSWLQYYAYCYNNKIQKILRLVSVIPLKINCYHKQL